MSKVQTYFENDYADFNHSYLDPGGMKDVIRRFTYRYNRRAIEGRLNAVLRLAGSEVRGRRVLEIGCGPGIYAIRLAQAGACVTGVDFSAGMIRVATANAAAAGVSVTFICGDFMRQDLGGTFDMSFAAGVIEYIPPNEQVDFLRRAATLTEGPVIVSFPKRFVIHALARQLWLSALKGISVSFFTNRRIRCLSEEAGLCEVGRIDVGILWVLKFERRSLSP
jgi:2-polyprenyl-3-methyl-5-hydroxy-6-metoxy-1,4-benzoquinol methylase